MARPRRRFAPPAIKVLTVAAAAEDRELVEQLVATQEELRVVAETQDVAEALAQLESKFIGVVVIAGIPSRDALTVAKTAATRKPSISVVIAADDLRPGEIPFPPPPQSPVVTVIPRQSDARELATQVFRARHPHGAVAQKELPTPYAEVGRFVRVARMLRGWNSQQLRDELAALDPPTTLAQRELSRLETGRRPPTTTLLDQLERVLGFQGSELRKLKGELDRRTVLHKLVVEHQKALLERIRKVDPTASLSAEEALVDLLEGNRQEARQRALGRITRHKDDPPEKIIRLVTRRFLEDSADDDRLFLRLSLIAAGGATRSLVPLGPFFDAVAADFEAAFQIVLGQHGRRYRNSLKSMGVARGVASLAEGAALQYAVGSTEARAELADAFADIVIALYDCLTEPKP